MNHMAFDRPLGVVKGRAAKMVRHLGSVTPAEKWALFLRLLKAQGGLSEAEMAVLTKLPAARDEKTQRKLILELGELQERSELGGLILRLLGEQGEEGNGDASTSAQFGGWVTGGIIGVAVALALADGPLPAGDYAAALLIGAVLGEALGEDGGGERNGDANGEGGPAKKTGETANRMAGTVRGASQPGR